MLAHIRVSNTMNIAEKRPIEIIEDDEDIAVLAVQTPDKKRKLDEKDNEPVVRDDPQASTTTTDSGPGKENVDPKSSPSNKVKKSKEEKEAERLAREEAKIQREKQRAEKQLARELERKKREEERLKREEEKQKREEEREAKRKEKEEAENKREQEKLAKERAQPRIASFFTRKRADSTKSTSNEHPSNDAFKSDFLPFHVKSNMKMFKGPLYEDGQSDKTSDFLQWVQKHKAPRGCQLKSTAKSVLETLSGDSFDESKLPDLMGSLCMKHLQFAEDLRPPYVGTWSRMPISGADSFTRVPGIEYDYDSEVEWVDDEEGEDIADEDELSGDEACDSDEMEDFLDDENDDRSNRAFTTSKVAIAKWNDGYSMDTFGKYCIQYCVTLSGGIDPYQDYWGVEKAVVAESPAFKGAAASKPLPLSITQLNEIIGLLSDTEGPKNIVVHVVSQKLDAKNVKVSKKTIESVMSRCMEKGTRSLAENSTTPKSSKAWCVIQSKLEFERSLIDKIQLKI